MAKPQTQQHYNVTPQGSLQQVKFYENTTFNMKAAGQQFREDWEQNMQPQGWTISNMVELEMAAAGKRMVVVTYDHRPFSG
jgi:hypothetical protein